MMRTEFPPPLMTLLKQLGIAVIYAFLVRVVLDYISPSGKGSIFFLASGFALAALLLWGKRYAWGILLGALGANLLFVYPAETTLLKSVGSTLGALFGAWLLMRDGKFNRSLPTLDDYLRLFLLGGCAASAVSAVLGATSLLRAGILSGETYLFGMFSWWLGDTLGVMLIAVPCLLWWHRATDAARPRWAEVWLITLATFLAGQALFMEWFGTAILEAPRAYWMFLFIFLAAVRLNPRWTSLLLLMVAIQAIWGAYRGIGFFAADQAASHLINYWFYMVILSLIGMTLSIYLAQRQRAETALRQRTDELAEAQQNLKLAVSAANTGLWHWDVSSGQAYFSSSWKKQLGYGENEPAETFSTWQDLIHPDDRADLMAYIERLLHSPEIMDYEAEYRVRHHDRSYRWILARGKKEINAQGQVTRIIGAQIDITERRQAEDRFKIAIEASPNAIVMVDEQSLIVLINSQVNDMFGYPPNALVGQPLDTLIPMQARQAHAHHVAGYRQHVTERAMGEGRELYALHQDGHTFRVEIRLIPITAESGHYVIASIVDLTAQLESEQKIHQLINFDPLTGLPNRSLLNDRVHQSINMANREGGKFALLFIDLDHFKNINDTLGHRVGDKLLIEVGERLKSCLRDSDTASRVGGDEFVLVCYGVQEDFTAQLASRLLTTISQPYLIDAHELIITPSIGVAIYPEDGKDFDTLYQHADTAMYQTKQDGRNDVRFFTQEMRLRASRIMALENAMHHALGRDQFHLVYQPQLAFDSGKVVGCEVLLRWTHPELGVISPAEFIPLAESTGRIVSIGAWVLQAGLQQLSAWMDAGLPEMILAVNLSAAQFRHKGLPDLVDQLLAETKIPPHCLELELTESAAMDDPTSSIDVMNELHQRGVLMSIDDFGTGYSSLSYLKKFNISKLKIDQSFVRDIVADADDRAIVKAIIQMAHSLGFKTIAEGVETEAQREFLVQEGCNEAQGYLFSRPLPADQFARYCQENLKKTAAN